MTNTVPQILKGLTHIGNALRNHPRLALLATAGSAYPVVKGVQELPNIYDKAVTYIHKKIDDSAHARDELKKSVQTKLEAEKKLQELKDKKVLNDAILASRAASQPQEVIEQDEPPSSESQTISPEVSVQEKEPAKASKSDDKVQPEANAKKEESAEKNKVEQQKAKDAAKVLTLGNFFDYTNPYFQYYTAPTALGLGLGGLLGGWKGSLLGAAGGAGLGALAKYLVDNDKIHMA